MIIKILLNYNKLVNYYCVYIGNNIEIIILKFKLFLKIFKPNITDLREGASYQCLHGEHRRCMIY